MAFRKPSAIGREEYERLHMRRFGVSNPERVENPVWEHMVRTGADPYWAREAYGVDSFDAEAPGWTYRRFGMPVVTMPDGRRIAIGGEHEDYYDPEFCIYNDVIVRYADDIEIYAYPREVFPPTDFHTATLVGGTLWIVGSLGYPEDRVYTTTPVLSLDAETYEVRSVEIGGAQIGQIYNHRARLLEDGVTIEIRGGRRITKSRWGKERLKPNYSVCRFNTQTLEWSVAGDTSSWRRFVVRESLEPPYIEESEAWIYGQALLDIGFPLEMSPAPAIEGFPEAHEPCHTLYVDGVPVCVTVGIDGLRIDVEGALARRRVDAVLHAIREAASRTGFVISLPAEKAWKPEE